MNLFINYPKWISPYVFPFTTIIRWYSLMYVFAFVTAWLLLKYILKNEQTSLVLNQKEGEDVELILAIAVSLIIGARLGSCLIYSGTYYYKHPLQIFWPFNNGKFVGLPGMSYHGGVIGAIVGALIYSKQKKICFSNIMDTLLCCVPFAYTWGRLGNFLNAELYGRVTLSPIGMVFPENSTELFPITLPGIKEIMDKTGVIPNGSYVNLPRHPSQLYEMFFEGLFLGAIMWFVIRPRLKALKPYKASSVYFILYGIVRFFIEYFREPDSNLGFIIKGGGASDTPYLFKSILNISMGQILCFIMIVLGSLLMVYSEKKYSSKTKGVKDVRNR